MAACNLQKQLASQEEKIWHGLARDVCNFLSNSDSSLVQLFYQGWDVLESMVTSAQQRSFEHLCEFNQCVPGRSQAPHASIRVIAIHAKLQTRRPKVMMVQLEKQI